MQIWGWAGIGTQAIMCGMYLNTYIACGLGTYLKLPFTSQPPPFLWDKTLPWSVPSPGK